MLGIHGVAVHGITVHPFGETDPSVHVGTGDLAASAAAIVGTGGIGIVGTGDLAAAIATVIGTGVVGRVGTGDLVADVATIAGSGVVGRVGTGALAANAALVYGTDRPIGGKPLLDPGFMVLFDRIGYDVLGDEDL